jgi:hypothetical protein
MKNSGYELSFCTAIGLCLPVISEKVCTIAAGNQQRAGLLADPGRPPDSLYVLIIKVISKLQSTKVFGRRIAPVRGVRTLIERGSYDEDYEISSSGFGVSAAVSSSGSG